MSDHAGTHVDAFKHSGPGGTPIDEMPLEDFYTSAIALDLSHVELGASISVREMEAALEESGEEIRRGHGSRAHGFQQAGAFRRAEVAALLPRFASECCGVVG